MLEGSVQSLFARGLAKSSKSSYSTAQRRYMSFFSNAGLSPLPLTEYSLCLFAAFLANEGLQAFTISAYLSGLRFFQISSRYQSPQISSWPWLHYVTRGIKRSQSQQNNVRLPITLEIMKKLRQMWFDVPCDDYSYDMKMLWAIACTAFFGFMRLVEIFSRKGDLTCPLQFTDLATDSHDNPRFFRILIKRAKNDPFGKGSFI